MTLICPRGPVVAFFTEAQGSFWSFHIPTAHTKPRFSPYWTFFHLKREKLERNLKFSISLCLLLSQSEFSSFLRRSVLNSEGHRISSYHNYPVEMDPWKMLENTEVVLFEDNSLVEELRELRKLRTAVMVEKCLGQNDVVTCPKPRRQQIRQCGVHIDAKVGAELSDIITSKASPPYYSVSPPIRAGNPLVQDARFLEQWSSQGAVHGVQTEGFHRATHRTQRTRSVSTMA